MVERIKKRFAQSYTNHRSDKGAQEAEGDKYERCMDQSAGIQRFQMTSRIVDGLPLELNERREIARPEDDPASNYGHPFPPSHHPPDGGGQHCHDKHSY